MSASLILVPSLGGCFPPKKQGFCWVAQSSLDVMVFILSYILFYVPLLSLRSLFFSRKEKNRNERQKGSRIWMGREVGGTVKSRGKNNCYIV